MKTAAGSILSLLLAFSGAANAQNPIPFKHIVILFQENRTPDNLFGAGPSQSLCAGEDQFEPGVDIVNGGPNNKPGQPNPTCSLPTHLASYCNPGHEHTDFINMYDGGAMDGACSISRTGCDASVVCPQYAFVPKADVQPYFDIALNYGFANYMFQTNQGPSFPAHLVHFFGDVGAGPLQRREPALDLVRLGQSAQWR